MNTNEVSSFKEKLLEELKELDEFFHDELKTAWVIYETKNVKKTCTVGSGQYRQRIYRFYGKAYQKDLSPNVLTQIIEFLALYAAYDCPMKELHLRVANIDNKLYYDLSNNNYEVIKISPKGWKLLSSSKALFKRFNNQKAQITPLKGGDVEDLLDFVNISKNRLLFIVYLVSCFIPDIQHPILILFGEPGQGKSTVSRVLKDLIDPCTYDLLSFSDQDDDFFIGLEENHLIAYDNMTQISSRQSDNLCKIVTGISILKRKKYTDKDSIVLHFRKCLILNSIENYAIKSDLLSRSLMFEVKSRKGITNIPNNELMKNFEKAKPYILGAIFDLISKSLKIIDGVDIQKILTDLECKENFRMSEFVKWGYAIAEAFDGKGEDFIKQYLENISLQTDETVDSNTLLLSIKKFMDQRKNKVWEGRPGDLLPQLKQISIAESYNVHSKTLPKTSSALTKKLNANKSILKKIGILYKHEGRISHGAQIILKKIKVKERKK